MKFINFKKNIGLISVIFFMGFQAQAFLVDGLLCFTQPQSYGPVREEQIVIFKVLDLGIVSPSNTKQKGENTIQYLHRMNGPLRTINPDVFKAIQQDINNVSEFKKSPDTPILTDDYKSRDFSFDKPCYKVPLAQIYENESKKLVLSLSPFMNLKKMTTPLSVIEWFSIAKRNHLLIEDYLGTRVYRYEKSPTV